MRKILHLLILFLFSVSGFSQVITGIIIDKDTKESLTGANIILDKTNGTITDQNGRYQIKLSAGTHHLSYNFIGYETIEKDITIKQGETMVVNISMHAKSQLINEVVVSASKFKQKISDVTVSMAVIKPKAIDNVNAANSEEVFNLIPGIDIFDSQPSIRGGSGYSYGAGSRVLVMVDDLPVLSPDASDVKWNFLPMENISQIEVIKGAASALFGSSALNGVINLRTAFPGDKPKTKITTFSGIYMNPRNSRWIWWETNPIFAGSSFLHTQKFGNLDFIIGANLFNDQGYREHESQLRERINLNLRWHDKKIKGLSYGLNTNYMNLDQQTFFIWKSDTAAYQQNEDALAPNKGYRLTMDPYITLIKENGITHKVRSRYFQVNNINEDTSKTSITNNYFMEYQFQKRYKNNLTFVLGFNGSVSGVSSSLYGNHSSSSGAIFSQFDKKFNRLVLSSGIRTDYFRIDREETITVLFGDTMRDMPLQPTFRMGATYRLFDFTFLRASYGQGYRFPSIAEKYTATSLGALNIFPNPALEPEIGWNTEIGIKQGLSVGKWNGYLDIAGFMTKYKNMMEFTFGVYMPDSQLFPTLDDIGFKSLNIGNAQITGIDVSIMGKGSVVGLNTDFLLGYTYINPVNLDYDKDTTQSKFLKYRYLHSLKASCNFEKDKFSLGFNIIYHSKLLAIDSIFLEKIITTEILPGFSRYYPKHNKGYIVSDFRLSYQVTSASRVSFILKNLFNKEYMTRPGDVRPPLNITFQYLLSI
ncbi:MAG TPA: TonB-dependent receptor [Bacteroidales bacterium]|nr:TonB-dependent receptor [Bacteroidales bacterium]